MDKFILHSEYKPTGDQPQAIEALVRGFQEGNQAQTLLGVTGSGKTFTMANVIQALNKPTLIIAHNKTLAAQLYGEFKEFFPENAVEYFVSQHEKVTKQVVFCGMWVVEHPDVVEAVVVRVQVKSGWMKRFCDFSLPAFLDNYIIKCYDVLHTQGKEYLVEDLIENEPKFFG